MIKTIRLFLILFTIQLLTGTHAMGKSMQIDEPFYKVLFKVQGIKYRVAINGADIKTDKSLRSYSLEIPVNQFVMTGENKFELQIYPLSKKGDLSQEESSYIEVEFRLYTDLNNYVVLSKLSYSAKNLKAGKPYDGSTEEGQYSLINHKFEANNNGEYRISKLDIEVKEDAYNKTFMRQSISMRTPFPEWKFINSDLIPDNKQFKTMESLISGLIGKPYNILNEIHTALANKDIDLIMHLFKERNDEMDKAYYYKSGTYDKMLREAFEKDFDNNYILANLEIKYAQPMISTGMNVMSLGTDSLIYMHNQSKSVFNKYDIYFRKDGDKWIITR